MITCSNCGNRIEQKDPFCKWCGSSLLESPEEKSEIIFDDKFLTNFEKSCSCIAEKERLENEMQDLSKRPKSFSLAGHFFGWGLLFTIFSAIGYYLYGFYVHNIIKINYFDSFAYMRTNYTEGISYFVIVISVIFYAIIINWIGKKRYKAKLELNKDKINELQGKVKENNKTINNLGIIPPDYQNTLAVRSFIKYIATLRAESIADCIELFEQERKDKILIEQVNGEERLYEICEEQKAVQEFIAAGILYNSMKNCK